MIEEGFLELLDPQGFKKNKQYIGTKKAISSLSIIMELYLFSIHSIDESDLNESQILIKEEILKDRQSFETRIKEEYLKFTQTLKEA